MRKWALPGLCLLLFALCGCTTLQVQLPDMPGPVPWTKPGFADAPGDFRFAVVADRTGGLRPGVLESAVAKLNILHPEFVMCVGDLIEGYTEDPAVLNRQWAELEEIVGRLDMPFFHVAGNHDILTKAQKTDWPKRFGNPYYHFLYKGVLFLVLCSDWEDADQMGEEQMLWIHRTLKQYSDVRWTFIFLHKPLLAQKKSEADWKRVEAMLGDRPCTVFLGHWHRYLRFERHNGAYHMLATTGGANGMQGAETGRFDMLAWVTMTDSGPRIANLDLNGIYPADLVTTATAPYADTLADMTFLSMEPAIVKQPREEAIHTQILLTNKHQIPLKVSGRFLADQSVRILPAAFDVTVSSNSQETIPVKLTGFAGPIDVDAQPPLIAKMRATYQIPGRPQPMFAEKDRKLFVDRLRQCPAVKTPPSIDGDLSDWKIKFEQVDSPMQIQWHRPHWTGPDDASYAFATAHDDKYLYIAVRSRDDDVRLDPARSPWDQDCILIELDARSEPERSRSRGSWSQRGKQFLVIEAAPGASADQPNVFEPAKLPKGTRVACVRTAEGLALEAAVPVASLNQAQNAKWTGFRMNVAQADIDRPLDADDNAQIALYWRPRWSSSENFPGSGSFIKGR